MTTFDHCTGELCPHAGQGTNQCRASDFNKLRRRAAGPFFPCARRGNQPPLATVGRHAVNQLEHDVAAEGAQLVEDDDLGGPHERAGALARAQDLQASACGVRALVRGSWWVAQGSETSGSRQARAQARTRADIALLRASSGSKNSTDRPAAKCPRAATSKEAVLPDFGRYP